MRFALAVSGGGDSAALMSLAAAYTARRRIRPTVLTVDHGLQPQSAVYAKQVVKWARGLGLETVVLTVKGEAPVSNIEDAAREARYRLMGEWCAKHNHLVLLLAHTREDQAETFLLRLARGSGVDGLSAMRPRTNFPFGPGPVLLRPLLGFARADLRQYLTARGASWIEDPMNADPRFARTKMRALLPALEDAGLSPERIAAAADHLSRARAALEEETEALLARAATFEKTSALIDARALHAAPREIGLRALAAALAKVAKPANAYRPRFARLERLFDALGGQNFAGSTLGGCRLAPAPKRQAAYGARTIVLEPEKPRRPTQAKDAPAKKTQAQKSAAAKTPASQGTRRRPARKRA